jgi:MFS family permease
VLVLLGVLFTIILAGLDNTIVSTIMPVALPELGGAHLYAWTFAAYMLTAAVSMPIWGPGSDRWGRRRTYLVGIVAFTVGSGLCAIARTMMEFIGARAIQGVGAGAVATLPFVLLGVVYPPNKRGRALGAASSAWAVASRRTTPWDTDRDACFMALGFPDQRADCHCRWVPRDRRNAREHWT